MLEDRCVSFFRMTGESFTALGAVISTEPIFHNASHDAQVSPLIQLATGLYFLGSYSSSIVRGAAQLGTGKGTAHHYYHHSMIAVMTQGQVATVDPLMSPNGISRDNQSKYGLVY